MKRSIYNPGYGVIYIIRNLITGREYVGQTLYPEKRFDDHQKCAARGVDKPLYRDMRKYGTDAFIFGVHQDSVHWKKLLTRETEVILQRGTHISGYNHIREATRGKGAMLATEHKRFLDRRMDEGHPDLIPLQEKLLSIGGDALVPPPIHDNAVPLLLEFGKVMGGPVTVKRMAPRQCHQNVEKVWKKRKHGIVAPATGYALSKDGLWRCHSWGLLEGGILETTLKRELYFGITTDGIGGTSNYAKNPSGLC